VAVAGGFEPAAGTVGDFDPPEQAATVTPSARAAAAHSCGARIGQSDEDRRWCTSAPCADPL
jgi:hypothetical protein